MTKKAIYFDMDNTLIDTQPLYDKASDDLVAFILAAGDFDPGAVIEELMCRQLELLKTLGFSAEMMPKSYEDTYRHFVPDATAEEIGYARGLAYGVYTTTAQVKPGVEQALRKAAQYFDLYLVTLGEPWIQQGRIDVLPFKDIFTGIHIVSAKDEASYRSVMAQHGHTGDEVVMVGDSLASDIIPSCAAGMDAIHIPAKNFAVHERGKTLPAGAEEVANITDAVDLLVARDATPRVQPKPGARPPTFGM